ncbi:MAG: flagellar biosynthetic protein FliR [Pirellulales bacterium]
MTALVLTNILLGLVGRSMPSLNIMSLGFGLNSMITLGMMALCLSAVSHIFEESFDDAIHRMTVTLVSPGEEHRSPLVE